MNTEVKTLWLEALRSGEYKHGRNRLKVDALDENDTPKFCCLGVLCEVYSKATGKGTWELHNTLLKFDAGSEVRGDFPPMEVLRWAGLIRNKLTNPSGIFTNEEKGKETSLSAINDRVETKDYEEIIEYIEKYF